MRPAFALLTTIGSTVLAQKEGGCSGLHLVYARATTEPPASYTQGQFDTAAGRTWSKGYGAAGYSLFTNITALIPGATGYPVHYPASMAGNSQGDGISDMVKHLTESAKACPQQKYAIGGHSQGGFVTTQAIPKLPQDVLKRVVAVAMFGAPACPSQVHDRCISYCQTGDPVCSNRPAGTSGGAAGGAAGPKGAKGGMIEQSTEFDRRQKRGIPDCSKVSSAKTSGLGSGGHLGYNADGLYVKAAACYVASKYKAGGTA